MDLELSPEAETVPIFPKTLGWNFGLHQSGVALGILCIFFDDLDVVLIDDVFAVVLRPIFDLDNLGFPLFDSDPILGRSRVQLFIIVGLKWQPSTHSLGRISELNTSI